MDEENTLYVDSVILFTQKEWNYVGCRKMDGTEGHHVKWNNPASERQYCMFSLICGIYMCMYMVANVGLFGRTSGKERVRRAEYGQSTLYLGWKQH
jgi:hypothetical protein